MLKIVADNAIPFVERFFSCIGELELIDGRRLTSDSLIDADVLVCRTVTKVNQQLLQNSVLRIVASPSSGIDHIDQTYLQQRSIECVSAPGSNARSVAEYILSALFVLADQQGSDLSQKTAGIIGCGNVGSLVRLFFQTIGIECLLYDPILKQDCDADIYCELADIQQCDIITLHVPLTGEGPFPTRGMLNADFFQTLADDVILVNTSRGDVIDEAALKNFLQRHNRAAFVIDVWENEPAIDLALLTRASIATPHIAGYSMDGKLRAIQCVFEQVCEILGINSQYAELQEVFPPYDNREIALSEVQSDIEAVELAVLASYDVRSDAATLRRILEENISERESYFDELRNNYPIRREFSSLGIALKIEAESLRRKLLTLGFRISNKNN